MAITISETIRQQHVPVPAVAGEPVLTGAAVWPDDPRHDEARRDYNAGEGGVGPGERVQLSPEHPARRAILKEGFRDFAFDTDKWPFVPAKWFTDVAERRKVRLVVIHSMEAPEKGSTAENISARTTCAASITSSEPETTPKPPGSASVGRRYSMCRATPGTSASG